MKILVGQTDGNWQVIRDVEKVVNVTTLDDDFERYVANLNAEKESISLDEMRTLIFQYLETKGLKS